MSPGMIGAMDDITSDLMTPADTFTERQLDGVFGQVESLADEMVGFLRSLVQIPTVNPPGEEYRAGAERIGEQLREFGYDVQYISAEGLPEHTSRHPRVNVIGRAVGRTMRPLLHFNGHFDVVPVGLGWTVDPFAGVVREGKVYGRGTADQKAGIAASVFAIEAIRRSGIRLLGTVEQSGTVDEESGGFAGVAYLAQQGLIGKERTDFVIITEPSNVDRICIGHRGVYWFKLIQHGRIGHGSMPYLGVNAAEHLGDFIHEVNHTLKPQLEQRTTLMPVEPPGSRHPSININSLFGGQPEDGAQTPCVIDRAGAIFDRRFLAEEPFEEVKGEIHELLEAMRGRDPLFQYTMEDLMVVYPAQTDPASPLIRAVARGIEQVLGKTPPLFASPGTYDRKHVTRMGHVDDCVAYGPGILDLAHQPDEYVVIEDLVNSAKVMAVTAMRLLGTEAY
jgi:succinyl-diaminopimelate desuccinylase